MHPPCEMMTSHLLPYLRGALAHRLRSLGHSQSSIAAMLGVTQAAVSQMLKKPQESFHSSIVGMGLTAEEVRLLIDLLEEDLKSDPGRANATLYAFWRRLLSEGRLCDFHRSISPQLSTCEMCITPSGPLTDNLERMEVLRSLEECVSMIENSGIVSILMPQVSMNMVYSLESPKSISDVAGIPGRIVKASGRVIAVGRPAFGGSQHLASVLLAVNAKDQKIRAAANIRNDEMIKGIVRAMGYSSAMAQNLVEPISEASIIESVAKAYSPGVGQPVFIFHEGGLGYEPATYIFGYTPLDVTKAVLELARRYLGGHSQMLHEFTS